MVDFCELDEGVMAYWKQILDSVLEVDFNISEVDFNVLEVD